jgi:GntR family transcriptional regulator, carbon starvation induced regulator
LAKAASLEDVRSTQGSLVYDRLRADVISGTLAPGQRLTLDMLKERYQVGVTPLREALYRLSASLLVTVEDQRGFRVTDISLQHFKQVITARESFETVILIDSIRSGTFEWEERVLGAHNRLKKLPMYIGSNDALNPDWAKAHHRFHHELLSGSGHFFLEHFQGILWDHATRYRNILKPDLLSADVLRRDHDQLLEAALARDVEFACAILKRHIKNGSAAVLAALTSPETKKDASAQASSAAPSLSAASSS